MLLRASFPREPLGAFRPLWSQFALKRLFHTLLKSEQLWSVCKWSWSKCSDYSHEVRVRHVHKASGVFFTQAHFSRVKFRLFQSIPRRCGTSTSAQSILKTRWKTQRRTFPRTSWDILRNCFAVGEGVTCSFLLTSFSNITIYKRLMLR